MVVLAILIVALDYGFKKDEPYFQLFTLADKLNLGLVLRFKEEAGWICAESPSYNLEDSSQYK